MNEIAVKVPAVRATRLAMQGEWAPATHPVVIGKDVLELLSTSMYVDPMTIYREYTQNAADAVDEARDQGLLATETAAEVAIQIDPVGRSIRIRDNGTGIPWGQFAARLSNLGASAKRGTSARGFRGVGRLAGLGYCQELIFRSRSKGESLISELRWDCRALKGVLRSAKQDQNLTAIVQALISSRQIRDDTLPARFFEVELRNVIRHRDDRLLNPQAVGDYLAQVAPVPFAPDFKFAAKIAAALRSHVRLGELEIRINGSELPLYRPHRSAVEIGEDQFDPLAEIEIHEMTDMDGGVAAVMWVAHHGYTGAIPGKALIKGFRLRSGNMQIGDNDLLEDLFVEPRFNGWAIGEVHIVDPKVIPNGRRDHFEQSVHFDNLLTQLAPVTREITRRCRQGSIARKWLREFELQKLLALEKAKVVARGGISAASRRVHTASATNAVKAMQRLVNMRQLGEDTRALLAPQAKATEEKVAKLLGGAAAAERDPLAHFKPSTRDAYRRIITLIYECTRNSSQAQSLVNKIIVRLDADAEQKIAPRKKSAPKRKQRAGKSTKAKRSSTGRAVKRTRHGK